MNNWYLPNGVIYGQKGLQKQSVLVLAGKVAALGAGADGLASDLGTAVNRFDAQGMVISRGFVDLHTHLRQPGFEDKETIFTGTQAAAAGGFTSVCPMPNTNPALDHWRRLQALQVLIEDGAQVKVHPIGALTLGRQGKEVAHYGELRNRGVLFFSDDGDPLREDMAEEVFLGLQEAGGVLINHLEEKALLKEGFFYKEIPAETEYLMLQRDLKLVEKIGTRYHAAHLSTYQAVDLIAGAKAKGLPVSAEVTPHHLVFTAEDMGEPLGNFQMKPPLRSERDRQALVLGLREGIIDLVATDHAPHGREKERGLFEQSPFGVTGLETAFPALYTHLVKTGQLSLERLLAAMATDPARLLGLEPQLTVGGPADLVALDLGRSQVVAAEGFKSKGTNSPFIGQTLWGWPVLTLVEGRARFRCES